MVELSSPTVISGNHHLPSVQMSLRELHLWQRQARAIGRSQQHLQAIERLIEQAPENHSHCLDVSPKTYQVRELDLEQFNRKALALMEATSPSNRSFLKQLEPLVQELKKQWRQIKHGLQRLGSKVLDYLDANSPRK
jgi:hypothetical protein